MVWAGVISRAVQPRISVLAYSSRMEALMHIELAMEDLPRQQFNDDGCGSPRRSADSPRAGQ